MLCAILNIRTHNYRMNNKSNTRGDIYEKLI